MDFPIELQYRILEVADWDQQPVLSHVCSAWRHFLQTSPVALLNRYSSDILILDVSKRANPSLYCPRFHRIVTGLTHFTQHIHASDPPGTPTRVIHPCSIDFDRSHVTFFTGTNLPRLGPSTGLSLNLPFTLSTLSTGLFANDRIILPPDALNPLNKFQPHMGYLGFYSKFLKRPASGVQLGLSNVEGLNPLVKDYIYSLTRDIADARIYFNWPDDFTHASVLKLILRFGGDVNVQYLVFRLECEDDIPEDTSKQFPSRVLAVKRGVDS